jgi:hypothetical protein
VADGWLSTLLGIHRIKNALNVVFPQRSTVKFVGATVTDDPTNKQTVVDITAGVTGSVVVRKNSGANVGTRPRLNFVEGTGVTITAADDAVNAEVDLTIAAAETLQQAYDLGGTIDATVASGTNNLLVRAAGAITDILLRFRRNVSGADGEQTLLKAPDAVTVGVDGTRLLLRTGAGMAATGSDNGSHAGNIEVTGAPGGDAVKGLARDGAGLIVLGGAGGPV